MNNQAQEQLRRLFLEKVETFTKQERDFFHKMMEHKHVTRNINDEFDGQLTFGQRLADNVAKFGGSWTFITIFGVSLLIWVILNSVVLVRYKEAFDPYPYILLNLFLSMLASIQAPIIMMSQNRQATKDRLDAAHDYEVNLKAEMEIENLHQKLDELRETQWAELVEMQQEQIRLLTRLLAEKSQ